MTLAEDTRPEATPLIGLSQYALQHQYCTFIQADTSNSKLASYRLVADSMYDARQIRFEVSDQFAIKQLWFSEMLFQLLSERIARCLSSSSV